MNENNTQSRDGQITRRTAALALAGMGGASACPSLFAQVTNPLRRGATLPLLDLSVSTGEYYYVVTHVNTTRAFTASLYTPYDGRTDAYNVKVIAQKIVTSRHASYHVTHHAGLDTRCYGNLTTQRAVMLTNMRIKLEVAVVNNNTYTNATTIWIGPNALPITNNVGRAYWAPHPDGHATNTYEWYVKFDGEATPTSYDLRISFHLAEAEDTAARPIPRHPVDVSVTAKHPSFELTAIPWREVVSPPRMLGMTRLIAHPAGATTPNRNLTGTGQTTGMIAIPTNNGLGRELIVPLTASWLTPSERVHYARSAISHMRKYSRVVMGEVDRGVLKAEIAEELMLQEALTMMIGGPAVNAMNARMIAVRDGAANDTQENLSSVFDGLYTKLEEQAAAEGDRIEAVSRSLEDAVPETRCSEDDPAACKSASTAGMGASIGMNVQAQGRCEVLLPYLGPIKLGVRVGFQVLKFGFQNGRLPTDGSKARRVTTNYRTGRDRTTAGRKFNVVFVAATPDLADKESWVNLNVGLEITFSLTVKNVNGTNLYRIDAISMEPVFDVFLKKYLRKMMEEWFKLRTAAATESLTAIATRLEIISNSVQARAPQPTRAGIVASLTPNLALAAADVGRAATSALSYAVQFVGTAGTTFSLVEFGLKFTWINRNAIPSISATGVVTPQPFRSKYGTERVFVFQFVAKFINGFGFISPSGLPVDAWARLSIPIEYVIGSTGALDSALGFQQTSQ